MGEIGETNFWSEQRSLKYAFADDDDGNELKKVPETFPETTRFPELPNPSRADHVICDKRSRIESKNMRECKKKNCGKYKYCK